MKRHGNLFGEITTAENLREAYRRARKGKGWQDTVKCFEINLDANLEQIRQSLVLKTFTTSSYKEKIIYEPKERIVYKFLAQRLALRLSKNDIFPVRHGIDFLGYRHFPGYVLIRKSTAKRTKRRLRALPGMLKRGEISSEQYRSSIASTEGWLRWANSHNLQTSLGVNELKEAVACE